MSLDSLNSQIGNPFQNNQLPVDPGQVGLPTDVGLPTTTTPPVTTAGTDSTGAASLLQGDFSQISGIIGSGLAGGVATVTNMKNLTLIGKGLQTTEVPIGTDETMTMKPSLGSKIKGVGQSVKEVGGSTLQGAKYGAIIGGAISALTNGYQVLTGQKSSADAVSTFAADTVSTTISGAGGGLVGGASALAFSAMGLGGLPLTILAAGLGLTAAVGTNLLVDKVGLYDTIKQKVGQMLGKNQ